MAKFVRFKNFPFSQATKRFLSHFNSFASSYSSLDLKASHHIKQDYVLSNRIKDKALYFLNSCKSSAHIFQIQAFLITSDLFQDPSFSGRLLKLSADLCDDFYYTVLIFRCIDCPDTFCVNRIIKHYSCSSYFEETMAFYIEMLKDSRFYPNNFTFPPLISACAKMNCLSLGKMCQGQTVKFGVDGVLPVQNSLIHFYACCFDPPRHDSAETIRRALHLGVNVKMITGDQLAIAKETGRRLGMGVNMYPSASLLGQHKDEAIAGLPVEELIEKADGFAGVFPEHKYEIVKKLQESKHIVGMTGDGVNDAPALKKADIGIAVADATDAARGASDIVLTEPGLSVIISAVLTSRAIFQRMKNYTIYAVSITIRIVFGFMFIALIWKFDFSPFMVLIIAILNDGTIMTISKDRVKPSPLPDSWKLKEIFSTGVVIGGYLAMMTVIFFWLMHKTSFFPDKFGVKDISNSDHEMMAALYLQVSIVSQALIFVTRSRSWSYSERPGLLLMTAFVIAQTVATLLAVYANWGFARIQGCGWGWAGVIWIYSVVFYVPLDFIKFAIRYILSGNAWKNLYENKTAFTTKKDYGKEEREAQWALAQRTLHGLQPQEATNVFNEKNNYRELSEIAEQAKRRAEIARLRELHTLKGHVESVVKLKGLDIETIQQHYTV